MNTLIHKPVHKENLINMAILSLQNYGNKIILRPEYQRDEVWTLKQQRELIDSILNEYRINPFYFRLNEDDKWEVIDGQQRLTTILAYMANRFKDKNGLTYENLSREESIKFDTYNISIIIIEGLEDDKITERFMRCNSGTPINSSEKRNANKSAMGDFIRKTVNKHPIFKKFKSENNRLTQHDSLAQLILLSIFPKRALNPETLDNLYINFKYKLPDGLEKSVNCLLNIMNELMSDNISYKKVDFITYYTAAQLLMKKQSFNSGSGSSYNLGYLKSALLPLLSKNNLPTTISYKTTKNLNCIYKTVEEIING